MSELMATLDEDQAFGPRTLFTAHEVAETMAISLTLVRHLTLTGELPCRRIGRLVRYTRDDVLAFVASRDDQSF